MIRNEYLPTELNNDVLLLWVHKQSATIFTWLSPKKRCKTVTSGGLSDEYQMSWEKEVCRRRLNCLPSPYLNQYPLMKWGFSEETDIVRFRLCDVIMWR